MTLISPSILAADTGRFREEAQAVEGAGADWLHLDIMDGHFVPNITFGPWIVQMAKKAVKIPLDAHLMVSDPLVWGPIFAEAGADYVSIHVETTPHLHKALTSIKDKGAKAGVAINPTTPCVFLEPLLPYIDLIIVMGVNPGFAGQPFIPETTGKVRQIAALLKNRAPNILLEVDGGVTDQNARDLGLAGATALVSGSHLFKSLDYGATIRDLKQKASLAGLSSYLA
ncbi:MAG: ribulose-phosphate 3-epimerase [Deltaproteobacteria bacterium]|jgi:ribulose-phosphate 3-epimerase|nr:ribulose-phosphate 3-epimerase [Deltaproteobacteria bacterium]